MVSELSPRARLSSLISLVLVNPSDFWLSETDSLLRSVPRLHGSVQLERITQPSCFYFHSYHSVPREGEREPEIKKEKER